MHNKKPLIFIGTNSNLTMFVETAQRAGYSIAGILDNDYYGNTKTLHNIPVIGTELYINDQTKNEELKQKYDFFIATNWSPDPGHSRDTTKRKQQIELVESAGITCINLIDSSAHISPTVKLGQGIYIGNQVYIEPDVVIGDFCQIYYGVGIAHGSSLGKNTVIQRQAGILGVIGNNCYIGMWSKIFKTNIAKIGDNVIINPGLYVARDVHEGEYVKLDKDSIKTYRYMIQTI